MRRLEPEIAERVLKDDAWPQDFDRYETLLRLGLEAGKRWRFVDPLNSSLPWTAADIAKERPGISVSEIAELLNLDPDLAKKIARKAVKEKKVKITFDGKRSGRLRNRILGE